MAEISKTIVCIEAWLKQPVLTPPPINNLYDALTLLKEQQAEIKRLTRSGEWKRMSDLPIEKDDRFECSNCGNVVHYKDRINLYTFNDYCGRCGAYNGFKLKDGEQ